LADLILIEKRLERLKKEKARRASRNCWRSSRRNSTAGCPWRGLQGLGAADLVAISGFRFLTQKPLLLVLNVAEAEVAKPAPADLASYARESGLGPGAAALAPVEMDIAQMSPEEQKGLRGFARPGRARGRAFHSRGLRPHRVSFRF